MADLPVFELHLPYPNTVERSTISGNPTSGGGTVYTGYDAPNTGRIEVTGLPGMSSAPRADVGDVLRGATAGTAATRSGRSTSVTSSTAADVVVLGDLNDYQFSPALATLTRSGILDDLITHLPADERYSYVYQGNSQVLDHILTSPGVARTHFDVVHVNAEFTDQTSDHDPEIVRLIP